jgi:cytochrome c553
MVVALLVALISTGCWKDDMGDDAHIKPMEASGFFADGKTARPLVAGTVPHVKKGEKPRAVDDPMYAVSVPPAIEETSFPFVIDAKGLERGRQQYNIYCAVCHGATGKGDGMIVQRGFPHPPSFYLDRLRKTPHGHYYNVITHGYGAMYSYGDRIVPEDRWRVAAYVRALQLSDTTDNGLADTPPAQREKQNPAPSSSPSLPPAKS